MPINRCLNRKFLEAKASECLFKQKGRTMIEISCVRTHSKVDDKEAMTNLKGVLKLSIRMRFFDYSNEPKIKDDF